MKIKIISNGGKNGDGKENRVIYQIYECGEVAAKTRNCEKARCHHFSVEGLRKVNSNFEKEEEDSGIRTMDLLNFARYNPDKTFSTLHLNIHITSTSY